MNTTHTHTEYKYETKAEDHTSTSIINYVDLFNFFSSERLFLRHEWLGAGVCCARSQTINPRCAARRGLSQLRQLGDSSRRKFRSIRGDFSAFSRARSSSEKQLSRFHPRGSHANQEVRARAAGC